MIEKGRRRPQREEVYLFSYDSDKYITRCSIFFVISRNVRSGNVFMIMFFNLVPQKALGGGTVIPPSDPAHIC